MFKKIIICLLMLLVLLTGIVQAKDVVKPISFWTGGGDFFKLEDSIIKGWNKENPDKLVIYNPIPAGASSEMVIQVAISTNTAPNAMANLEIFFANYLGEQGALVPLDTLPGFDELVKARKINGFLDKLRATDGHIYVLPQTWSPALVIYNKEMLDAAGFKNPPKTYGEFNKFAKKVSKPGETIAIDFDPTPAWWKVGYYIHTFYMSATGGEQELNKDGFLKTDRKEIKSFIEFASNAFKEGYASTEKEVYDFYKYGNVGCTACAGPQSIGKIKRMNPDLEYVIAAPPVPDYVSPNKQKWVDASTKGIGIVKSDNNNEIIRTWEFIKWHFMNPENGLKQLEIVEHLPMRGDLLENPVFGDYFEKNKNMKIYAEYVPFSNCILHPLKVDIYNEVKKVLWEPLVFGKKDVDTALKDVDEALKKLLVK